MRYSEIEGEGYRSLREGDRILYEVSSRGERGLRTTNVRRIG